MMRASLQPTPIELRAVIETIFPLIRGGKVFSDEALRFPVSRRTSVELRFFGQVETAEWDALLAQITLYRSWHTDITPAPALSVDEVVDAVERAIRNEREKAAT